MKCDIETYKKYLDNSTDNMLKGYCPMNSGYCTKECMHFVEGSVIFTADQIVTDFTPTKCKLWK